MSQRPVVGSVGYLNARPLTDGIDRERYQVRMAHPAAVAGALLDGWVDVALVPVAAVLAQGDWRVVPGVCIGAEGPVDSVLLVAEQEPEHWTRVALDGESRTSAVLARLLLGQGPLAARVGEIAFEEVAPGAGVETAGGTTASLVIGDAARALPDRLGVRLDLSALWHEWTGLPFVFAVWAGRPDLAPDLVAHLQVVGRQGVSEIASRWDGDDRTYLSEQIRYDLDDRALMGLRRFGALAHAAGLLRGEHLQLFGPGHRSIPVAEGLDATLTSAAEGGRLDFQEAMRLDSGATLADLAAAADMRRADAPVRWRLGWHYQPDGDLASAVAGGVSVVQLPQDTPPEVAEALVARWPEVRFQVDPVQVDAWVDSGVWCVTEDLDRVRAAISVGLRVQALVPVGAEGAADRVRRLLALRDLVEGIDAVQVIAVDRPGQPAASGANTAVDHLRATALARLMLSGVDLVASPDTEGLGMAQGSLRMGCSDFGVVFVDGAVDSWSGTVDEIERSIRAAGFEPLGVQTVRAPDLGTDGVAATP